MTDLTLSRRNAIAALAAPAAALLPVSIGTASASESTAHVMGDEFERVTLAYLRLALRPEGIDHTTGEPISSEIAALSDAIRALSYDAPGAFRAKAASAVFWAQHPGLAEDVQSEHRDTSTVADLILASAAASCPDYAAKVMALFEGQPAGAQTS